MRETQQRIIKNHKNAFKIWYKPRCSTSLSAKYWKTETENCPLENSQEVTVVWSENDHPLTVKSDTCKECLFRMECASVSEECKD